MSYCVQLHMKDKKVLIVGGGAVAYRKAKQFLKEEALVSIISPHVTNELKNLPINLLQRNYQPEDCEGFFYVYAATNDILVNHQVIIDANQKYILTGSATQDELVTSSSMYSIQEADILCAVSTQGAYPAFHSVLKEDLSVFIHEQYQGKLPLLKQLREYILINHIQFSLWKQLAHLSLEELTFLVDVIKKQRCSLYAFHGVVNPNIFQQLYETMDVFQKAKKTHACGIVFFSDKVCKKLHHQVSSLPNMTRMLKALGITMIEVYPMLVGEGEYEQNVRMFCEKENLKCYPILCANQHQVDEIVDGYVHLYPDQDVLFVSHDVLALPTWNYLQTSIARYPYAQIISCKEQITCNAHQEIRVIPLVMLLGHHATNDILHGEQSICTKLANAGMRVHKTEHSLFDQAFVKQRYRK